MKGSIECPQCGSDNYSTTLMGYPTGRDANRVSCISCGWHGTAEDWITIKRLRDHFRLPLLGPTMALEASKTKKTAHP